MGSPNHWLFLKRHVEPYSTLRIIEIGSKDHGSAQQFREKYQGEYVGIDIEDGKGVDLVANLEDGPLDLEPADLVICCSVLEHTPRPWVMAERMLELLKPGGGLYVAVPWTWRYHPYPEDYWRISFAGVRSLFPGIQWAQQSYSGLGTGDFWDCQKGVDDAMAKRNGQDKMLPYLDVHSFGRTT